MTGPPPVLRLATCIVRPWSRDDADALARHANDREVWRNLRDRFPHPYTRSDARRWLAAVERGEPGLQLAIEVDDEAAGGIGVVPGVDVHRRTAEIGYWLARPFWGRGIATEAVRAVTELAFERYDLARVQAFVYEWNPASGRVLEKAGYALEGRLRKSVTKDGRTIDSFLYARVRE